MLSVSFDASSASTTSKKKQQRWFEIEVILFSQLGDKTKLKEAFPDSKPLPKYRKSYDLLTPQLSPDLSILKLQLPDCKQTVYPSSFAIQNTKLLQIESIEQAADPHPLFSVKSLTEIELIANDDLLDDGELVNTSEFSNNIDEQYFQDNSIINNFDANRTLTDNYTVDPFGNVLDKPSKLLAADDELETNVIENGVIEDSVFENNVFEDNSANNNPKIDENTLTSISPPLTAEQLILVSEAEQHFDPIQFNYSPAPFSKSFCNLPEEIIKQYQQENPNYNVDAFDIEKVATTISGAEHIDKDKPYLLNKNSLQLADIVKQLRRSKNFRPLLHIGWRQSTFIRKKAIPFRLFAGDNLALNYQNQQQLYQDGLVEALQQELTLDQLVSGFDTEQNLILADNSVDSASKPDEMSVRDQFIQARIDDVISQLQMTSNQPIAKIEDIIADLNNDNLTLNQESTNPNTSTSTNTNTNGFNNNVLVNEPELPLQPWYIDGLFKVHVKKYLYITVDFNIVNFTLAEQATQAAKSSVLKLNETSENTKNLKTLRFQQNRRVISGQIHYFDHPYMGMIVQIRKHKRPVPSKVNTKE